MAKNTRNSKKAENLENITVNAPEVTETPATAENSIPETPKAEEPKVSKKDLKEQLVANIQAHISEKQLPGTFTLTTEKFYLYKEGKATVKFQPGAGICRIRANNAAGQLLQAAGIEVTEHSNWNIKYAVETQDFAKVLDAVHEQLTKPAEPAETENNSEQESK